MAGLCPAAEDRAPQAYESTTRFHQFDLGILPEKHLPQKQGGALSESCY